MDGADWLRTQLTSFGCAACGQAYEAGHIHVLAERDGLYFVDLGCGHCGTQAVAIVTVQLDEDDRPRAQADELTLVGDGDRSQAAPVSADDVLAMHRLLEGFEGDVGALLHLLDGDPAREQR
jgi:hypothetical protein